MKQYMKPKIKFMKTQMFERVAANCFNYGGVLSFPYGGNRPPNHNSPAQVNVSSLYNRSGECTNAFKDVILQQLDLIWADNQGKPEDNSDAYVYNVIGPNIDVNTTDNDYVNFPTP